jgi:predicted ferric reductase
VKALPLFLVYIAVVVSPLALAAIAGRPPRSLWDELASGAGMLAFAIILVEFVLSGRFRSVSGKIGMDVTMRMHQLLARTALALVIVHPFLYRAAFNPPRPWDVTRALTVTADLSALASGILAWGLLPAFVVLSIGRDKIPYRYEVWRALHGAGAAVLAALILHHVLSAGRYSADPLLAGLWVALSALAAFSLVFVYVIKPLRQMRRPWRVDTVRAVGPRIWELTVRPVGHDGLAFTAGQFVWLNVGTSPFSLAEHPFSIGSAPSAGKSLSFVIKEFGDFTAGLGQIEAGTRAYVDGPHGNLTVPAERGRGIALIAGGVGIAPLLSILRELDLAGDPRPTVMVFGNATEDQIVYRDELERMAARHGTELVLALSEPPEGWRGHRGRADAALMKKLFAGHRDRAQWLYVLCGPPAMMEAAEAALMELGVPPRRILSERFKYD